MISNIKEKSVSNLLKWFFGKPKEQTQLFSMIRAFQIWGGFWIISGIIIKAIREPFVDGPIGTLLYAFVFLLPILIITLVGSINQKKQR
jgi:hypothetical protein